MGLPHTHSLWATVCINEDDHEWCWWALSSLQITKYMYIFFIQSLHAAPINPKAHRLWCLHPFVDVYTLSYNFTVTSRCDPAAFTLCFSSKPHREGGDRIFGERFQYEKSPSGDEKSSLPLTSKRPHCSLTLKYVSIYLLFMWDIWGSAAWGGRQEEVKWKHMWAQARSEERRPRGSPFLCIRYNHTTQTLLWTLLHLCVFFILLYNNNNNIHSYSTVWLHSFFFLRS